MVEEHDSIFRFPTFTTQKSGVVAIIYIYIYTGFIYNEATDQ